MAGYNPHLKGPDGTTKLTGNPTQAQQLLAQGMQEEGYNNINALPILTLSSFTGNTTFNNIVNEVVNEWKTVLKVNVKVNLIDFNRLTQEMNATTGNDSLQMWAYGWQADYPDPQDWLSVFFGTGQSINNYGDKRNKVPEEQAIQGQLFKADAEQDNAKRLSLYNDAEQKLVNSVAWLPLYQPSIPIVQNPKLHGYKTNALQITDPDSWRDVYFTT
jgi:peptide/nickel transport system substrate-binding protein/oligopeptide transport system substrate-binding protein